VTVAEYARAYRKARIDLALETRRFMTRLRSTYAEAAREAARQVAGAELAGAAEITTASWARISAALEEGSHAVQRRLEGMLPGAAADAARGVTLIDEEFVIQAARGAGATRVTPVVVRNVFLGVSESVVKTMVSRIYADGYSFSERIWRAGAAYQDAMKQVVTSGIAVGRDAVDVAADLTAYVRDGRAGLMQRWGKLVRGNADFARRIRKDVDYNALRLVRSELYSSLQEAGRLDGLANPACEGLFDWKRYTNTDFGCECQDLADGGPYTAEDLPGYPHPSCSCLVTPRLMDLREFVRDLRDFERGGGKEYLEDWYRNEYLRAA
jgi:hypothetical protein